jgi:hypothetical protein
VVVAAAEATEAAGAAAVEAAELPDDA